MQIAQCKKRMIIKYHYLNANIVQKNQILISGSFQTFFHLFKCSFFGKQEFRNDFLFLQSTQQVLQIHMSAMSLFKQDKHTSIVDKLQFYQYFVFDMTYPKSPIFDMVYINISRNIDNSHSRWILKIFTYFWRNASLRDILEKRNTNAFFNFQKKCSFLYANFYMFLKKCSQI